MFAIAVPVRQAASGGPANCLTRTVPQTEKMIPESAHESAPADSYSFLRDRYLSMARILLDADLLRLQHSYRQAALKYGAFRFELTKHLSACEQVLVPWVVAHCDSAHGLTSLVSSARGLWRELPILCEQVGQALSQWNDVELDLLLPRLREGLQAHGTIERQLFQLLPPTERPDGSELRALCYQAQLDL